MCVLRLPRVVHSERERESAATRAEQAARRSILLEVSLVCPSFINYAKKGGNAEVPGLLLLLTRRVRGERARSGTHASLCFEALREKKKGTCARIPPHKHRTAVETRRCAPLVCAGRASTTPCRRPHKTNAKTKEVHTQRGYQGLGFAH